MSQILAVGSMAYDSIETWAGKSSNVLGGSATYFSVAASLFSDITIVAVVGEDFKQSDIELLNNKNIKTGCIEKKEGKTFHWEGVYPKNGDAKTIKTELNVFEFFNPVISQSCTKIPILFLGNIDPDLQLSVIKQMDKPKLTICDTMDFWITRKKESLLEVVKNIDVFIINYTEVKMLSGKNDLIEAVHTIMDMGPKIIVVKNGARGANLFYYGKHFVMPACPVEKVIDPTGAGDSFAGGFVGYIAKTLSSNKEIDFKEIKKASVFGNITASFTIEDFGLDKLKNVTHNMIESRFAQFQDFVSF